MPGLCAATTWGNMGSRKGNTTARGGQPKTRIAGLMSRLEAAGFKRDFAVKGILPDWWTDECWGDDALLPQVQIRVARFLGLQLGRVADPAAPLSAPSYANAMLRRVRDVDRDRLAPAIHVAVRTAAAVVRNLRADAPPVRQLPSSGGRLRWLAEHAGGGQLITGVASVLWGHGIPVVPLGTVPNPSFQAMACIAEGRPVIATAYQHDEPARVAFWIAHEAGHLAHGDCSGDGPVVDGEEAAAEGEAEMERNADRYATEAIAGPGGFPELGLPPDPSFKDVARRAATLQSVTGIDSAALVFSWARETGRHQDAALAVKALYKQAGARRALRAFLSERVDADGATETDGALLRCVLPPVDLDEAAV